MWEIWVEQPESFQAHCTHFQFALALFKHASLFLTRQPLNDAESLHIKHPGTFPQTS